MTTSFRHSWQKLRESLWFVPSMMMLGSFALATGLIEFDRITSFNGAKEFPLLFGAGAEGSRGMLTAIAGSMLTVAALAFSLTLTTITQVSSQYSPRVLRNFMSDKVNQLVMGYFVGVFSYCLIVLGTIRGTDENKFVPATAVLAGLVLALGGVAALIYFIHHIAESLQTGTIVRHIFQETVKAIDNLYPNEFGESIEESTRVEAIERFSAEKEGWWPVVSDQTGYLQQVDTEGLLDWASRYKVVIRIEREMGAFVGEDTTLFSVRSGMERTDPEKPDWPEGLLSFVSIGKHRSVEQDLAFGIQQLVDIALKALSPGINDTTTASMAIDYIGAIISHLAKRKFPSPYRSDNDQLRILTKGTDFNAYVRLAFDLTRINAKGNHAVFIRLLQAILTSASVARSDDRRPELYRQTRLLIDYADQTLATEDERNIVHALHRELQRKYFPF